ncbi:rRNA 2'-O-methyltransferase fibrillarin-like [Palaemon carinicauda]|uniref:rRNA 2'-O-methyltransferase fibrillarin-like n=1 Tax=Palaemon carinicauda TaxID=392227 RepID=UPI0035B63B89
MLSIRNLVSEPNMILATFVVVLLGMVAADPVADPESGHIGSGFHRGIGGHFGGIGGHFGGHGFGGGHGYRGKRIPEDEPEANPEALAIPEPEADPGHFGRIHRGFSVFGGHHRGNFGGFGEFGGFDGGYGGYRGKRSPVAEPEHEAEPGFSHGGFRGGYRWLQNIGT